MFLHSFRLTEGKDLHRRPFLTQGAASFATAARLMNIKDIVPREDRHDA